MLRCKACVTRQRVCTRPAYLYRWLSNLPETTCLPVLVRTAKLRWRIEHDYREMKQTLGLAHFEGRTWPGWHHHVTLVSVAHPLLHPAATEPIPKRDGVGLSLYRVVRELQLLLATSTGACPTCHRDMPDLAPT